MSTRFAVFCFGILAGGTLLISAQESDRIDTIRIETRLVSVPVVVADRHGRYVPDLRAEDFTVLQDGVPQAVEFFAAVEEPLTLALLIDTSQSTQPVLDDIKDSARSLIKLLSPRDQAMIVAFDYDTHVLTELTSDQDQLKRAIKAARIPEFVGTRLRDAAYRAVTGSLADIKGRKAVIVLTDGKDVDSRVSREELIYSLQESDSLVYTIMFRTGFDRYRTMRERHFDRYWRIRDGRVGPHAGHHTERRLKRAAQMNERAVRFLNEVSDTTGGRFFATEDGRIKGAFAAIIEELRLQYRLGFYPPDDGDDGLHEIKVKIARPDVAVRSRKNYRTAPPAQ